MISGYCLYENPLPASDLLRLKDANSRSELVKVLSLTALWFQPMLTPCHLGRGYAESGVGGTTCRQPSSGMANFGFSSFPARKAAFTSMSAIQMERQSSGSSPPLNLPATLG